MTTDEEDTVMEEVRTEVQARYRNATGDDLEVIAMMLQDFDNECSKRIPGWEPLVVSMSDPPKAN